MLKRIPYSQILRRRLVALGVVASALTPLPAFAWTCTNPSGQTYSSSSPSYCSQYYPSCMSAGEVSGPCISPNFQLLATPPVTQTSTSTQTSSSPFTATQTSSSTSTITSTSTQTSSSVMPTSTSVSTSTNTYTSPGPLPVAEKKEQSKESTALSAAQQENKIAFEQAVQLQTTLAYAKEKHGAAEQYYRSGGKDLDAKERFKAYADKISGIGGIYSQSDDFDLSTGADSDVQSAKAKTLADKKAAELAAFNRGGKSGNGKSLGQSTAGTETAEVSSLLHASLTDKMEKLLKDASLRETVKEFLEENAEDKDNPEVIALAQALQQAEAAVNGKGEAKATALAAVKKDSVFRMDKEETQRAVGRLLASMGVSDSEANASDSAYSAEPLFTRVHLAHKRSLERGDVLSKLRKRR